MESDEYISHEILMQLFVVANLLVGAFVSVKSIVLGEIEEGERITIEHSQEVNALTIHSE